jgi:hypothetical protein
MPATRAGSHLRAKFVAMTPGMRLDVFPRALHRGLGAPGEVDVRTSSAKTFGDRPTDTAGRTRDDGDLTGQFLH